MALDPAQRMRQNVLARNRLNALSPQRRAAFTAWVNGQGAANAAPAPAPQAGQTFVLPGSAEANFQAQRADINESYMEGTAQNDYDLKQAAIAHRRDLADQKQAWIDARSTFSTPYAMRGLGRSGIYQHDLGRLLADRATQVSRTATDYARQRSQLGLTRTNIENRRAVALANNRMKHQALLGDAAARSIK